MQLAFNQDGSLTYSFIESVEASYGGYIVRALGGGLFFIGILLMAFNTYKTILQASEEETLLEENPDSAAQVA
jgi:cytochrome c oxidase cbb3-type subunit 1